MLFVEILLALFVGYYVGKRHHQQLRPKHQCDWEVVDKQLVSGTNIEAAQKLCKDLDQYITAPIMSQMIEQTKGQQMIVHSRCMCGAEKVERI